MRMNVLTIWQGAQHFGGKYWTTPKSTVSVVSLDRFRHLKRAARVTQLSDVGGVPTSNVGHGHRLKRQGAKACLYAGNRRRRATSSLVSALPHQSLVFGSAAHSGTIPAG